MASKYDPDKYGSSADMEYIKKLSKKLEIYQQDEDEEDELENLRYESSFKLRSGNTTAFKQMGSSYKNKSE